MAKRFPRLRKVVHWCTAAFVGVQFGAIAALLVTDAVRKKKRKPFRFPTTPPTPTQAGEDELTLYTVGTDLYADMLAAIASAESHIYFETYIWKSDRVGHQFKEALVAASERGVAVYVAYDEFANLVVPKKFFRLPPAIHKHKHPAITTFWAPRSWGRDHRKLVVVDDVVAFIGGYNVGSTYADQWRDTHARVVGPSVLELSNAFADFWNMHRRQDQPVIASPRYRPWDSHAKVQRNVPRLQVYPIRNMYLDTIDRAAERIWLTHAYLIPDDDLVTALSDAVARGVDVEGDRARHLEPRRGGLAGPRLLFPTAAFGYPDLPLSGGDGAFQDRDNRRRLVHRGYCKPGQVEPLGQLRDQPRYHEPGSGRADGGDLPHRPWQLRRVG